jgi:hypothetical protein
MCKRYDIDVCLGIVMISQLMDNNAMTRPQDM